MLSTIFKEKKRKLYLIFLTATSTPISDPTPYHKMLRILYNTCPLIARSGKHVGFG